MVAAVVSHSVSSIPLPGKIRIVTAASLFDGHDAAINIMRRLLQAAGVEVIHLGHDRSAQEVVDCAIQEDANAIAMTSYQGGHIEYFKYLYDLLKEKGCDHIKIFGGGGGTILPIEIEQLHQYGIERLYHPDDGRQLGLQGMINDLLQRCEVVQDQTWSTLLQDAQAQQHHAIARLISIVENNEQQDQALLRQVNQIAVQKSIPVLGITGTGGAGKSSLLDEIIRRFIRDYPEKRVAMIAMDPSKRKTGGALLGDRIRMNSVFCPQVYLRSVATRQSNLAMSQQVTGMINVLKVAGFNLIILETSGIGQSDSEIVDYADINVYVMTSEYGAASQLEKIDMIDYADVVVINKADKRGAEDALRDVTKQYLRSHQEIKTSQQQIPIFTTMANQFNDAGTSEFYLYIMQQLVQRSSEQFVAPESQMVSMEQPKVIPSDRVRYLSEIATVIRKYNQWSKEQSNIAQKLFALQETINLLQSEQDSLSNEIVSEANLLQALLVRYEQLQTKLTAHNQQLLEQWPQKKQQLEQDTFSYQVRGRDINVTTYVNSLSQLPIPKIALPRFSAWGELLQWLLQENLPGEFPFTAGVFPFKRTNEDPTRMFAGEGNPERTNKRFHYLSKEMPAKRLSTAFDSVTLYGRDPGERQDIYGKIGNAGVSICCLDDMKKLYSGFDLCDPATSVSMTINGPAPMLLAFFINAAIDQQCERYIQEQGLIAKITEKINQIYQNKSQQRPCYNGELPDGNDGLGLFLLGVTGDQLLPQETYQSIKAATLRKIRGTVQADILKEDQAQNTCIFSIEFALRMMGDIQAYFTEHQVKNFYSVSISGYHMAEAGANPITQLAFTLANGFTLVEFYLSRGLAIDDFAANLSFFFSNGIDPEYAVIGRVARRIWSKAMRDLYGADVKGQKLKYHIQTSGRSLHAQEIAFNDIRTTLQALYAIYDNCNSLHTNAYDEAITTPTEESVRRAVAIQLIINKELGLAKNENPLQGSFIIEELTDLVEEAVLAEFDRLTDRGGVLGAMETMYQRSKIQEESMYYETLKDSGEYPIVGVNTFLHESGATTVIPKEIFRSSETEKQQQINTVKTLQKHYKVAAAQHLTALQQVAIKQENLFTELLETTKVCTLGQITEALFMVGGQYRRSM